MKGAPSGPPPVATGRACEFSGCNRPHSAKGYCNTHYQQQRRGRELVPIKDRVPATHRNTRGQKRCAECRTYQFEDEFRVRSRKPDGLHSRCRRCERSRQLQRLYGIDIDTYETLLAQQGGVCAICGTDENGSGRVLAVDHDHDTGEVRGILCENCNFGIGSLQDDPQLLARAIEYLS